MLTHKNINIHLRSMLSELWLLHFHLFWCCYPVLAGELWKMSWIYSVNAVNKTPRGPAARRSIRFSQREGQTLYQLTLGCRLDLNIAH